MASTAAFILLLSLSCLLVLSTAVPYGRPRPAAAFKFPHYPEYPEANSFPEARGQSVGRCFFEPGVGCRNDFVPSIKDTCCNSLGGIYFWDFKEAKCHYCF